MEPRKSLSVMSPVKCGKAAELCCFHVVVWGDSLENLDDDAYLGVGIQEHLLVVGDLTKVPSQT